MKSPALIVSFIALITGNITAQKELSIANWQKGETKKIYNHNIQKFDVLNTQNNITNISYQSAEEMVEKVKKEAKDGNWEKNKTDQQLDQYRVHAKGGIIQLFVVRESEIASNLSHFTIKIYKDEKEIQKKTLKNANGKKSSNFAPNFENTNFMWLAEPIKTPFEIHVLEALESGETTLHKFKVLD